MKNAAARKHLEILIVEDSRTQAEELRYILENEGFKVVHAANGKESLDLMKNWMPDIVVTDILMPEMDGYEVCRYIRSDERLKDVPVILVTSLSEPTDVIKGLEAGADNFITKPYDEKYIVSRIEYLMANKELREGSETELGVRVYFSGQDYLINAERLRILDLLFSTYENAYHQNRRLLAMQRELSETNERLEQEKAKTESILESIGDGISIQDRELRIIYQNRVHISVFGDHRGEKCHQAYRRTEHPCDPCSVLTSFKDGLIHTEEIVKPVADGVSSFEITTSPLRDAAGDIISVIQVVRNVDERKRLEQERENLIADLTEALGNIKTLSGLIPICANCKKIRQDSGYWQQIEAYISDHSDAKFTHGICPECAERLFPEIYAAIHKK